MKYLKTIVVLFTSLILFGCASERAHYITSGGPQALVSTKKINMGDWNNAAKTLSSQMLSEADLSTLGNPAMLKLSRIVNRTSELIDTDLLTKQVAITLNKTNKVRIISEDAATLDLARAAGHNITPTATLSGKIIETRDSVDGTHEVTYTFFLELNYQGISIWMGQIQIAKQTD